MPNLKQLFPEFYQSDLSTTDLSKKRDNEVNPKYWTKL